MTKSKSVLPVKGTHGGRRPGAGAPKGNLNGLKHGLNSQRFYKAALMIAVVPELRLLFHALQRAEDRKERQRYLRLLAAARHAAEQDPDIAGAIKALVLDRLQGAPGGFAPGASSSIYSILNQAIKTTPTAPSAIEALTP